jgi:hypothetical protein
VDRRAGHGHLLVLEQEQRGRSLARADARAVWASVGVLVAASTSGRTGDLVQKGLHGGRGETLRG